MAVRDDVQGTDKRVIEENARPPWRALMSDVSEMMQASMEEAEAILDGWFGPEKQASDTVRMAVSIFEATVTAEGGRRIIEAQQRMAESGGITKPQVILRKNTGIEINPITGRPY